MTEGGRTGFQRVFHLGEAAMTTFLPAECRFGPTVLSATIPSYRQPRAHRRAAVQDTLAFPGYKILGVLGVAVWPPSTRRGSSARSASWQSR